MSRPALSISGELNLILEALETVRLLAELEAGLHLTKRQQQRAARATGASLLLIRERVRSLDRVVRGLVDPAALLVAENGAHPDRDSDEGDVAIPTWGTKRTLENHRRELERAERRAQSLRDRKKVRGAG